MILHFYFKLNFLKEVVKLINDKKQFQMHYEEFVLRSRRKLGWNINNLFSRNNDEKIMSKM